ncbi:MAG: hypothetical protein U0350_05250 [Caldilineaceae bacterium]
MATPNKKRTRSKSSISTARPRSYSEMYKNDTTVPAQAVTVSTVAKASEVRYTPAKSAADIDWKEEYKYVMSDLRLLLIVSVVLIAIIILAGFFI